MHVQVRQVCYCGLNKNLGKYSYNSNAQPRLPMSLPILPLIFAKIESEILKWEEKVSSCCTI